MVSTWDGSTSNHVLLALYVLIGSLKKYNPGRKGTGIWEFVHPAPGPEWESAGGCGAAGEGSGGCSAGWTFHTEAACGGQTSPDRSGVHLPMEAETLEEEPSRTDSQ